MIGGYCWDGEKLKDKKIVWPFLLGLTGFLLTMISVVALAEIPDAFHHVLRFGPLLILLSVVALIGVLVRLIRWLNQQNQRLIQLIGWFVVLISIGVQLFLAFRIIGDNIYDGMDIRFQAVNLLNGSRHWIPYFHELAQNNVPITMVEYGLLAVFKVLHINGWLGLNLVMFAWIDLTIGLLWSWVSHRWGQTYALILLVLAAMYFPFYGYALFFYTDGVALLFPVLTLWLLERYFKADKRGWILLIILGIELWLGFWLKGNNGVLLIATLLVLLGDHYRQGWRKTFAAIALLLVLFGVGVVATPHLEASVGYEQPQSKKMPLLTWTMMGLNYGTQGSSSHADTGMIQKQSTYAKKQTLAVTTIKARVRSKGVAGLAGHLLNKLNLMWSDGNLDATETINQAHSYSKLFQYLYGSNKLLISSLNQVIYVAILGLSVIAVIGFSVLPKQLDLEMKFIILTILGVFSFHLLFWEAEARYVLLVFPLLLVLATFGLKQLAALSFEDLVGPKLIRQKRLFKTGLSLLLVAVAAIGMLSARRFVEAPVTQSEPVVQQTKDYGNYVLKPGHQVTQRIWLSKAANAISIQNPRKNGTKNISAHVARGTTSWRLKAKATSWSSQHKFKAGTYKLTLYNRSHKTIKLAILDSRSYNAVPAAKPLNQNKWHHQYLLFKAENKWQQPLFSAKKLALLIILITLVDVSFIWLPKSNRKKD